MGNFPHMVNYRTVYVYVIRGEPTINRASNKSWVQSILYHIIGISWGYEAISFFLIYTTSNEQLDRNIVFQATICQDLS